MFRSGVYLELTEIQAEGVVLTHFSHYSRTTRLFAFCSPERQWWLGRQPHYPHRRHLPGWLRFSALSVSRRINTLTVNRQVITIRHQTVVLGALRYRCHYFISRLNGVN